MIGIMLLSLLAAVSASHLSPFLPYPRVDRLDRVYDYRFDPYLRGLVPVNDPHTVVDHAELLRRGLIHSTFGPVAPLPVGPVAPLPVDRVVYRAPYPLLNRGVVPSVPAPAVFSPPVVRDGNYFPFFDRLSHYPLTAPIAPELPLPAPPAPVITSLDALPSSVPFLPSTGPLVHPAPFTPFIPPSTLIAPLPVEIKEEDKKVEKIEEPVKTEMIEDKKEMIESKELEPELKGDEKFSHEFVEENGTVVKEEGAIVDNVLIKKGRYSYTSPEGVPVEIKYIADHNGYRIL